MRASVLFISLLVAAAIACPLKKSSSTSEKVTTSSKSETKSVYSTTSLPPTVPVQWQIKLFKDQYATIAYQGPWYLQMAVPTSIVGANPLKTGLFYNVFPCFANRAIFYDNTPTDSTDFNLNYIMLDSSFNIITQKIETTQSFLTPAYPGSNLALFNVGTQQTYKSVIKETNPLTDETISKYELDEYYKRGYTVAIVGSDDGWNEYMVFVILNEYDNLFSGSDDHIIWMFTREQNPSFETYQKAFDDIKASGLNPYTMISIDQSIDLTTIPTVTEEDIKGVVHKTTVKTQESSSITSDGSVTSSSSSTTLEEETVTTSTSTVEVTLSPTFSIPYKYEAYTLSGDIKILRDLKLEDYRSALKGLYYLNAATPVRSFDGAKPGLLNTVFPNGSPQLIIDDSDTAWQYSSQYMMVERNYDITSGKLVETRNIIQSAYDGSVPYASFVVYSEGYSTETIVETTPFSYDKITVTVPSDIYKLKYVVGITAYKPDEYLILYMYNQFPNKMYPKKPVNPLYVLTKDRIVSKETSYEITQEIIRSGYLPSNLVKMDQTKIIENTSYKFDKTYFYPTISPSTPRGLLPPGSYPPIIPPSWNVKTFTSQEATLAVQGTWYLQLATPTKIKGLNPLTTGLFATVFPGTKNRVIIQDTTPLDQFDFNTNYYWLDSSFNLITQQVETTQGLLKAAYPTTNYAIFNIATPKVYSEVITEKTPLVDSTEVKITLDGPYKRDYTVAVVGADCEWKEYLVIAVVNEYENLYTGSDHIIWVFTRDENPDFPTYKKAYDDILASGLSPYGLVSVDQSIDLTKVTTVTEDEIKGVVKTKSIHTEESTSSTVINGVETSSSSSSKTTVDEKDTVVSTFDVVPRPDFVYPYKFDTYELAGNVKILRDLTPVDVRNAFSGKYHVNFAAPVVLYDNGKAGLFNTVFPSVSLYTYFEEDDKLPWDYNKEYLMLDGGYNALTGKLDKTRTVIKTPNDGSLPYNTYLFYNEGYYKETLVESTPFSYEKIVTTSPGGIYTQKYMAAIAGYKPDKYLALYVLNQYTNKINVNIKNQMYIMTRSKLLTKEDIDEITQTVALSGYDFSDLVFVDQTKDITEEIKVEASYFELVTSSSSSSVKSVQSTSVSVTEETKQSSSSAVEVISS